MCIFIYIYTHTHTCTYSKKQAVETSMKIAFFHLLATRGQLCCTYQEEFVLNSYCITLHLITTKENCTLYVLNYEWRFFKTAVTASEIIWGFVAFFVCFIYIYI